MAMAAATADSQARVQTSLLLGERARLGHKVDALLARIAELDRRLGAAAISLPPAQARYHIGSRGPDLMLQAAGAIANDRSPGCPRYATPPVTHGIFQLLRDEAGGRSIGWLRKRLLALPDQREKMIKTPAGLNVALKRLQVRGHLIRRGDLYYLPEALGRIERGELDEVCQDEPVSVPFSHEMFRVLNMMGGQGSAGAIVAAARADDKIGATIGHHALKVYRWLSKQTLKGRLAKEGGVYGIVEQ